MECPLGTLTNVALTPQPPEQPQARVPGGKRKSHCRGLAKHMSCTLVYDGNKQRVFSVEYKGRGSWRDAMLSVEHLPFQKAPRWMPEGYRLAIMVERLPAPDYSWPTASIAEEQVLRTMQSPLLPRYCGSLKTNLDGQPVFVLAMQAAYKTVED